jgi:hypothetical protein
MGLALLSARSEEHRFTGRARETAAAAGVLTRTTKSVLQQGSIQRRHSARKLSGPG